MFGIDQPVTGERHPRPSPARLFEMPYARGGVSSVRRALFAQLGLALVVASIGALLSLLYAPQLSVADLAIILALSWLIYVADGALAIRPIREGLVPLEEGSRRRGEASAREGRRGHGAPPLPP